MSSIGLYSSVDKMNNKSQLGRNRESLSRFQAPSIGRVLPVVEEIESSEEYEPSINRGNILFVYLDIHSQLTAYSMGALRLINDDLQIYTDLSSCLDFLQSSKNQIFFISSFTDKQSIEYFHNATSIEAMFFFNCDAQMNARFPKLVGVYDNFEKLLAALQSTLQWFEQTQMELFVFERERIFLWSQLWKEELIRLQKLKFSPVDKENFIQMSENYYRGHLQISQMIEEFDQTYTRNDALQWCFFSSFPSRFLHRALHSHNTEHLQSCQFLFNDVSRMMQISIKKSNCELYKGMKMTYEYLDRLRSHVGQLICPTGYFQCHQSRKAALDVATSSDYRPDLVPVVFKIIYDSSVPVAELHYRDAPSMMVFDVYTVFRVKHISHGPVPNVKLEVADDAGAKFAREYRMKYRKEDLQTLLDKVLYPPKPPQSLAKTNSLSNETTLSVISEDDDEILAQDLVNKGQIEQAIAIYKQLKPESARIFIIIGGLYAGNIGNYGLAIEYYEKALNIQEMAGEDVTDTLSQLGVVHQNRGDFVSALSCHSCALQKRKMVTQSDQTSIASNLVGIANAYWGQQNLTEALNYAQQALALNESVERGNDLNIGTNLAILANIHYHSGNTKKALEIGTRALGLLERFLPPDSLALASLINNIATIQVAEKSFREARHSFDRALEIFKKSLPEGHPKRVTAERNIQRIVEMERKYEEVANHIYDELE